MILLLSIDQYETTTEEVMDWLEYLGVPFQRVNGDSLVEDFTDEGLASTKVDGIAIADVSAVWYRRWNALKVSEKLNTLEHVNLYYQVVNHLSAEKTILGEYVLAQLQAKPWLSRERGKLNKLLALQAAKANGLLVPDTLVTTTKADLLIFLEKHPQVITKVLSDGDFWRDDDHAYSLYTELIDFEVAEQLPDRFFPSLFQGYVAKAFEVRTFYLAGDCYSMAIFSQADEQTRIDFRHYNHKQPNRTVPYTLPEAVEHGLRNTMQHLGLETGSIDWVRTPEGEHVFLEINPVGQFGMVSYPCNYFLEKKVAEHLSKIARKNNEQI